MSLGNHVTLSGSPPPTVPWALLAVLGQLGHFCSAYLSASPEPETPSKLQSLRRLDSRLALVANSHVLTFLLLTSLLRQLSRMLHEVGLPAPDSNGLVFSTPFLILP